MKLLRKFAERSWSDKALLVNSFLLVCGVRLGLWALPYRTVVRLTDCEVAEREGMKLPDTWADQRRVVGAVEAIGRRLLGDKPCLTQAIVARRLLRKAGQETDLRIGVRRGDQRELLAHAWLEKDGRVIIGGRESPVMYEPLVPLHA